MNWLWGNRSENLGIYNAKELREHLGLDMRMFNLLMREESLRYKKYLIGKYKRDYYEAKIKESPLIIKYGNTPIFDPHPFKSSTFIFNNKSGVYLEKTWSNKNKHNIGKGLPFNFVFKA